MNPITCGPSEDFKLKPWWEECRQEIDIALDQALPKNDKYLGRVGEAMRYALLSGGKRFRPLLAMGAAEALGQPRSCALSAAVAYEMVHSFSLAHDDLPCMDDDDERRGMPTTHKVFGEACAVLAGDGLAIWAFRQIVKLPEGVPAAVGLRLVEDLADASGHPGMVGGQVLDIEARDIVVDRLGLERIHRAKTGALIRGAVRAGAMLAGASERELEALTRYGEQIGLVFQMTDDVLDAGEDPEEVSYPQLLGLDETLRLIHLATSEALAALESFGPAADPLRALASFLEDRKA